MEFNLADMWEAVVDTVPDREALVWGQLRYTFRELDDRANRVAHALSARRIGSGDHVAVYLRNRPEFVETMFAAFKLRAVPINVNYRYVADELRYLLDDADVKAVVVAREFLRVLQDALAELPLIRTIIVVDDDSLADGSDGDGKEHENYEAVLASAPTDRGFPARSADDGYIVYTGGTTGMPKGVLWRSEDIFFAGMGGGNPGGAPIERPEDIVEFLDRPVRGLPACPLMHGTANWFAIRILFGGGAVVLSADIRFEPVRMWELIARERVSFLVIVGDAFARPLVDALDQIDPGFDVSCLRWVLSSGAIFSPGVKHKWLERMPTLRLIDGFGSSETGSQGQSVAAHGITANSRARFELEDTVQVFDDDDRPAEPGTVGRLGRRGHIPVGYYGDPVKTRAVFREIDGVRWSIPGDYAVREADGTITVLGRGSACINTGGEKVYPEEVESVIKSHPDVLDALVVGVPDDRWGERVVAVVAPRPGTQPTLRALEAHAREYVAGYKVPREVVVVDAITRTPSGKPDYAWAKATALAATA
ncbi:MAG: acyl-CoA synthetase [Acidimicrobiia bacterium]